LPADRRGEVLDFATFLQQRVKKCGGQRPYGLSAGEFKVPEDFDSPLPEAELRLFE
jgi:hypothetical protein